MYKVTIKKLNRFSEKELIESRSSSMESTKILNATLKESLPVDNPQYNLWCKSYARKKSSCTLELIYTSVKYKVSIQWGKKDPFPDCVKNYVFLGLDSDSKLLHLDLVSMLMNRINHDFSSIEYYKYGGINGRYHIEFKLSGEPVSYRWYPLQSRP